METISDRLSFDVTCYAEGLGIEHISLGRLQEIIEIEASRLEDAVEEITSMSEELELAVREFGEDALLEDEVNTE